MRTQTQQKIEELLNILSGKELTPEEQNTVDEFHKYLRDRKEFFIITSIHRDDLISKGIDGDKVSDGDMETLASKMADDYCEQLFWESMQIIATEGLNMPLIADQIILFSPDGEINENPFDDPGYVTFDDIQEKMGKNLMIAGKNDYEQLYIVNRGVEQIESNLNRNAMKHASKTETTLTIYGNCLVWRYNDTWCDLRAFNFYEGQKVWWNDPDEGKCSGERTIHQVYEETVWVEGGNDEIPFDELEIRE